MEWYAAPDGKSEGPLSEEQFQHLVLGGRITSETLVWHEGMPDWVAYGSLIKTTPPAIPVEAEPPAIPAVPVKAVEPVPSAQPERPAQEYIPPIPLPPEPPKGDKNLAVMSLVLGLASFVCFGFLASIPAVILGHLSLSRIKQGRMPSNAKGLAVAGLAVGYVNIAVGIFFALAIFSSVLIPAVSMSNDTARRSSCQNNLKQMGIIFKMFSQEHDGRFPKLSATPGQMMCAKEEIYSEYLTDANVLVCPASPTRSARINNPAAPVDDDDYFYLGYAVSNEKELAAFCAAYRDRVAKGSPFDGDLKVPEGQGIGSTNVIYRLRDGIERFLITDINNPASASMAQAAVPILIEGPNNHVPGGGNVLYMDGHVEFLRYPGPWPMTEKSINMLKELTAMRK